MPHYDVTPPEGRPATQIKPLGELYDKYLGYKTDGYFVEVGAFDGVNWSNTYPLARIGWRGLLIEPQPEYVKLCHEAHAQHPGIKVLQCAIGDHEGTAELYTGGSISTIMPEMVDTYNATSWGKFAGLRHNKSITVKLHTLDNALTNTGVDAGFDVLVIDIEGAELEALAGFSVDKWRPRMVLIEAHELHPDKALSKNAVAINAYFAKAGYERVHVDEINSVFVREAEVAVMPEPVKAEKAAKRRAK